MPQTPLGYNALNPALALAPLNLDNAGDLRTSAAAKSVSYNITAAAVVKATKGRVWKVNVIVAGSVVGTVNDCATTGAAAVGNQVFSIPNTTGVYSIDWNCGTGIVVVPGTGQTIAVSYE